MHNPNLNKTNQYHHHQQLGNRVILISQKSSLFQIRDLYLRLGHIFLILNPTLMLIFVAFYLFLHSISLSIHFLFLLRLEIKFRQKVCRGMNMNHSTLAPLSTPIISHIFIRKVAHS